MNIDISKLKGRHVYPGIAFARSSEIIRPLARDERIWEFNKMLLIDETYDKMYDDYFDDAMDKQVNGRPAKLLSSGE